MRRDGHAVARQHQVRPGLVDHVLHRLAVRPDVGNPALVEHVGYPKAVRAGADVRGVGADLVERAPGDVEAATVHDTQEVGLGVDVGDLGRVARRHGGVADALGDAHVTPALRVSAGTCQKQQSHSRNLRCSVIGCRLLHRLSVLLLTGSAGFRPSTTPGLPEPGRCSRLDRSPFRTGPGRECSASARRRSRARQSGGGSRRSRAWSSTATPWTPR